MKKNYLQPQADVLTMRPEGVLCVSGIEGQRNDYGDAITDTWVLDIQNVGGLL